MVCAALSMRAVVDVMENEEVRAEVCVSSGHADPVVYQLVRVDGSGRLVPATDDEVMAVEDLLEEDKSKGTMPLEVLGVCATEPNVLPDCLVDTEGTGVHYEEGNPLLVPDTSDGSVHQPRSKEESSKHSGVSGESKTSTAAIGGSSKPDFSLLEGEIRLDNLSVRDLQETFKATFGRETSVKDKQWLKRRIIMGLTNSCDFSTTSFVIAENRLVKKGKEETCIGADCSNLVDIVVTSAIENQESQLGCCNKQVEIHSSPNETDTQSAIFEDSCGSKDVNTEQRPAKRVRKPTKRYIEELSEEESRESGVKFVSSVRHTAYNLPSAKVYARPVQNISLVGRCLTRNDSLGGSGVQVPYVSRIRRSRPRENLMSLMKLQSSAMGMSTRVDNNSVSSDEQLDNGSNDKSLESSLPLRWTEDPIAASSEECDLHTERKTIQQENEVKPRNMDSYKNNSDDEVVTVPTVNGGMRRKHHRPWTLTEVVKLVEGVAKYGAGRWSEIKRLAFASYSYRTSVDLKDKWRNLLRASVAELPTGNVQNSRKQASVPIPASILSRVRELADIQTQVHTSLSSSKLVGGMGSNRNLHEMGTRSGFL